MSKIITALWLRLRVWRYERKLDRYERKLDRIGAELECMSQLRDFSAREAERLQRELIETWREAEEACRGEP